MTIVNGRFDAAGIIAEATGTNGILSSNESTNGTVTSTPRVAEPDVEALTEEWPELDDAARRGLAGEVVAAIEPHTEADPAALLISCLVGFGNSVGDGPHALADGSRHPARLNAVIVGKSSRSRKGTSWRNTRNILEGADFAWMHKRVVSGLSSGEGLITAVSDGIIDKNGKVLGAVTDKRLLVVEEEFARALAVKGREHSTLSAVIRQAFDDGNLHVLTKEPLTATRAHISILGHITIAELRKSLTMTDVANGFGNRFLWACARRSQVLPSGGQIDSRTLFDLATKVNCALDAGRRLGLIERSADSEALWSDWYKAMAIEDDNEGTTEYLLARAEAHVLRLSVVYAVLDNSQTIELAHLQGAIAVWNYCCQSVRYVFGEAGDEVAHRILIAVAQAEPDGLDREQQSALFSRHLSSQRLAQARSKLVSKELVVEVEESTGGRRQRVLHLARKAK